jgi:Flp pilus assembly pilin Flp
VIAFRTHTEYARDEHALEEVMKLITRIRTFVRSNEAQDLLEYALLVALIAIVATVAIRTTGTNVKAIFENIATALKLT